MFFYRSAVLAFKVGDQVEVVGSDGVLKHAFYTANVRSVLADGFEVQYHTRMTDDGEQKAEIVAAKQIRPIPDVIVADVKERDFVEVWMDDGWWRGVVVAVIESYAVVFFAYKTVGEQNFVFPKTQLRIPQKWHQDGDSVFWMYRKRLADKNIRVGEDVEVVGTGELFNFSMYRARVHMVFGDSVQVEYCNRVTAAGAALVETVASDQVRYIPDVIVGNLKIGDFVEAWVGGGWWGGVVFGGNDVSVMVYFAYKPVGRQQMVIPKAQIRLHQKSSVANGYALWMYKKSVV